MGGRSSNSMRGSTWLKSSLKDEHKRMMKYMMKTIGKYDSRPDGSLKELQYFLKDSAEDYKNAKKSTGPGKINRVNRYQMIYDTARDPGLKEYANYNNEWNKIHKNLIDGRIDLDTAYDQKEALRNKMSESLTKFIERYKD